MKNEKIKYEINEEMSYLYKLVDELRVKNAKLKKENEELKNNKVLHNENDYNTVIDGNEDLSYVDEYAKGLEEFEKLGYIIE